MNGYYPPSRPSSDDDEPAWLAYLTGFAFFGTLLYVGVGMVVSMTPVILELIVMLFRFILRL